MKRRIALPLTAELAKTLRSGDEVLLTGEILTARDAAHKRLFEAYMRGERLPVDLADATIYYAGPTPAKEGQIIGSCGPTTSCRMDAYSPALISLGARGMIGKGERSDAVIEAIRAHSGVYFGAIGGAGALISKCVKAVEVVAYEDLGTEAIRKLSVVDMPLVVVIDSEGNDLYKRDLEEK